MDTVLEASRVTVLLCNTSLPSPTPIESKMPLTPLDEIDSYVALSAMLHEVERMSHSEFYDPEALTMRCASIASAAAQTAHDTVARVTLEGGIIINQMLGERKITLDESRALLPELISADLSEQEMLLLSSVGTSWHNTRLLLRISRLTLLVVAFVLSFLSEQWIRTDVLKLQNDPSEIASRVIIAVLIFIAQLLLFGDWQKTIERHVQWKVFDRVRHKLQSALPELIRLCSRAWKQTNAILLKIS